MYYLYLFLTFCILHFSIEFDKSLRRIDTFERR